jgi:hypothetical protein
VLSKLWVDDLRPPPDAVEKEIPRGSGFYHMVSDTWMWAKSSADALGIMDHVPWPLEELSLDHDLGGDDTTRPIVLMMCEYPWVWPKIVRCHSANPVGREWIEGMVARYKPET